MPILKPKHFEEFKMMMSRRDKIPVIDPQTIPLEVELERQTLEEMLKTNVTTAFEVPEEYLNDNFEDNLMDAKRHICGGIANFMGPTKEEDNMTEEMWSLYQVLAVEKSEEGLVEPTIDKKVIAKNGEHAKGLAGVNDLLEKYNYDNTKLAVRVSNVLDIRPVEDYE